MEHGPTGLTDGAFASAARSLGKGLTRAHRVACELCTASAQVGSRGAVIHIIHITHYNIHEHYTLRDCWCWRIERSARVDEQLLGRVVVVMLPSMAE